ncbi:hypothetical protein D3C86_1484800 [compost metagenome]
MVGAGIVAEAEDRIGMIEILQRHRAFADADGFRKADAGGLVAHVGTIREIVRPIGAHEKLIEKGGLVGRPAGCIEFRLVGVVELVEFLRDQIEGVVPRDWLIAIAFGIVMQGKGQTAGILQLVIRPLPQFGNRMLGEKFGSGSFRRRFPGDGLGAVFAELEG